MVTDATLASASINLADCEKGISIVAFLLLDFAVLVLYSRTYIIWLKGMKCRLHLALKIFKGPRFCAAANKQLPDLL